MRSSYFRASVEANTQKKYLFLRDLNRKGVKKEYCNILIDTHVGNTTKMQQKITSKLSEPCKS